MKRTSSPNSSGNLEVLSQLLKDQLTRSRLGNRLGFSYEDKRKIYQALGYPSEKDLTFEYYYNLFDRNEIANAIIARPANKTWDSEVNIMEDNTEIAESPLSKAWFALNDKLNLQHRLNLIDQLSAIGQFALLLLGLSDVKERADWEKTAGGASLKLLYVKQIAQSDVKISEYESDAGNPRYGLPKTYTIALMKTGETADTVEIRVHWSRVIHINHHSLVSEYLGTPVLKPIVNRVIDLEKVLGGDAEMFWRGARPGYQAKTDDNYEMGVEATEALTTELDNYEHDLRRFIQAQGVSISALEQQIADPLSHIDAQLQAISAQTGIPKRILVGSERGELSSSEDRNQWLALIKSRMTNFAGPKIIRPLVDRLMSFGILPKIKSYSIIWPDIFAVSEADKVDVGKKRAEALKVYAESTMASEVIPLRAAIKYLLGLSDEAYEEVVAELAEMNISLETGDIEDEEDLDPDPEEVEEV